MSYTKYRRRRYFGWRSAHVSISDRRLFRDRARGRIAGVCAGLAEFFAVSTTMTRFVAITALIFVPQITLFAYLLATFLLPTREDIAAENDTWSESTDDSDVRRERERQRDFDRRLREDEAVESMDDRRRIVRQAKERIGRIERRIQGLEAYVTSKRFDLNREFGKL